VQETFSAVMLVLGLALKEFLRTSFSPLAFRAKSLAFRLESRCNSVFLNVRYLLVAFMMKQSTSGVRRSNFKLKVRGGAVGPDLGDFLIFDFEKFNSQAQ